MEMSCDEGAIKALKTGTGEDYAATLLNMATSRVGIGKSCALALRETNAGERVTHIVKYKKTGLAAGVISVIIILLFAVGLLSNPTSLAEELKDGQANVLVMCSTVTFIIEPFVGLHYTVGTDEISFAADYVGNIRTLEYHIMAFSFNFFNFVG